MKRKGIAGVTVAMLLVFALAGAAVVLVPEVRSTLLSSIGIDVACEISPFDSTCICDASSERIALTTTTGQKYICESVEKFIDPSVDGWETSSTEYAAETLARTFPDCDMNTCQNGDWSVAAGVMDYTKRIIKVECNYLDQRFSELIFNVADGAVVDSECANYVAPPEGDRQLTISYKSDGPGYNMVALNVKGDCKSASGPSVAEYTYNLPVYMEATDWWFHSMNKDQTFQLGGSWFNFGTCEIIQKTQSSVSVSCESSCTGYGTWDAELTLRWSTPSTKCSFAVGWGSISKSVGSSACCAGQKLYCSTNGLWFSTLESCVDAEGVKSIQTTDNTLLTCS